MFDSWDKLAKKLVVSYYLHNPTQIKLLFNSLIESWQKIKDFRSIKTSNDEYRSSQVIEVFNDWANMIAQSNHQIKDDDLGLST
jgi:hypothetical protein